MPKVKFCNACKTDKPFSDYYPHKNGKFGLNHRCSPCHRRIALEYARNNPEAQRSHRLMSAYGIDLNDYRELLEGQGGVCAICGKSPSKRKWGVLVVDHCHATGRVRGLLCRQCNSGLGAFGDNQKLMKVAIQYLELDKDVEGQ